MNKQVNGTLVLSETVRIRLLYKPGTAIQHGLRMLSRDIEMVLGKSAKIVTEVGELADISIRLPEESDQLDLKPEGYGYRFVSQEGQVTMEIIGSDDLGLIYGMLEFSRQYLGIQPFWFWADQAIERQSEIIVPIVDYDAPSPKVRFRGWFVNDEVCLIGWKEEYPPSREVWEPVFEALLRCGGNMVLPGTDLPRHGIHFKLAAEMGLWVTHHHAEPLGAEMFLRVFPGRAASYHTEPALFERLWREAIEEQKDMKVVWVLSFRGQGDKPFWIDDPVFDTSEKRGDMISKVISRQYDMINESVDNPVCCVALYGEIAELYKGGYVQLPDDVIKIWADNGYGKMVSRRHNNLNYRVHALPSEDDGGKHGLYYHVTFHDLQASNHLTMFPGSSVFIKSEIESAFAARSNEYLLLNCGNIRPHIYTLDIIRELWLTGEMNEKTHLQHFVKCYYTNGHSDLEELYQSYADAAIAYGPNEDDWAGDEYYHHPARQIIGHWLQGKTDEPDSRQFWAVGNVPFAEQVKRFGEKAEQGVAAWRAWLFRCDEAIALLNGKDKRRAIDHLRLHGALHLSGCEGFYMLCKAYEAYAVGKYPQAFVYASESMWRYSDSLVALRDAEHGKWESFYKADWLTNIESTVNNVDTLRRFIRMHGDSPDFFLWYKEYLMPETEKYIYLENTHRNPLSDDELARQLKVFFSKSVNLSE
ncbi:hypothetical protein BK133_14680 [Paenibacillus sp. FSL H8-0548]|uniref:glycosyl hydrolase 115 family protein n=1 Tax=Paenibacillus sp. FSL H8-0548 TaxID=1920422 RepID=UPI00096C9877|nr:glycosyl hydrolase 115 family protein [Paenibacillus sp. FSL H8-0548]OMF32265.1 hypothetical protein BK133_14680 [Paenibacillus sp. FSL H8-0548]